MSLPDPLSYKLSQFTSAGGVAGTAETPEVYGKPSISKLHQEIHDNEIITQEISGINKKGLWVHIQFKIALTAGEIVELGQIVTNHTPSTVQYASVALLRERGGDTILNEDKGVLRRFISDQPNEIHISKAGEGDYTSLGAAIATVNAPGTIYKLHAGTYVEQNPILLPTATMLQAMGTPATCMIVATNPNAHGIILSHWSKIMGLCVTGCSGPGSIGVYYDGSGGYGSYALADECVVKDCFIGLHSHNGPGVLLSHRTTVVSSGTPYYCGYMVTDGGQFISASMAIGGPADSATRCTGAGSKLSMTTTSATGFNHGSYVDDGGYLELTRYTATQCGSGITVGPTGKSKLRVDGFTAVNIVQNDLTLLAPDSDVNISTSELNPDKIYNPYNVKTNLTLHSAVNSKIFATQTGEWRVGTMLQPSKAAIGEGKYNTSELVVLHGSEDVSAGPWIDISSEASTKESDPFMIFPDSIAGSCLYIGSSKIIPGVKMNMINKVLGNGIPKEDYVWEYLVFDDPHVIWVPFKTMSTTSSNPSKYTQIFLNEGVSQHIRFGLKSDTPMSNYTCNGSSKVWVRLRLLNAINNIPSAQYMQLHTNSFHIDNDGSQEYFGMCRAVEKFQWNIGTAAPSNFSLDESDIYVGQNIGMMRPMSRFENDKQDQFAFAEFLPLNIDTSFPIKLDLAFIGDDNTAGNVQFKIRWTTTNSGSPAYSSAFNAPVTAVDEQYKACIVGIPANSANQDFRAEILLDIENLHPDTIDNKKDIIWISVERDSRNENNVNDDYPGNVSIIQTAAYYVTWRKGGHLSGF